MSKQHDITPGEEASGVSFLNNGDLPWTVHISRHVPSRLTHVTYFTARARWWYVCALPSEDSDMFGNGCCTCCLLSISQLFPHHTKTAGMRTKYLKFLLKHKWNHATACTAQHDRHPSWVSSQTQKWSKMTQTFQGRTSVIKISGMKWSRNLEICTSEFLLLTMKEKILSEWNRPQEVGAQASFVIGSHPLFYQLHLISGVLLVMLFCPLLPDKSFCSWVTYSITTRSGWLRTYTDILCLSYTFSVFDVFLRIF